MSICLSICQHIVKILSIYTNKCNDKQWQVTIKAIIKITPTVNTDTALQNSTTYPFSIGKNYRGWKYYLKSENQHWVKNLGRKYTLDSKIIWSSVATCMSFSIITFKINANTACFIWLIMYNNIFLCCFNSSCSTVVWSAAHKEWFLLWQRTC